MQFLLIVVTVAFAIVAANASAEEYPSKPIRLVIPFAPSGTDILARVIAAAVSESLGQQGVVDNRPGAGGAIGAEITVRAAPDGYTLNMTTSSYAANSAYRAPPFDPVRDIQPVILVGTMGLLMAVHPSVPVSGVADLVAHLRKNPGKLGYGSVGNGSINHLALELFKLETATDMVHVPYKGAGPGLVGAVSGEIQVGAFGVVASLPHVKAGRLRAIGITTPKRAAALPDVLSIGETVPGYEVVHWVGIWGPRNMPRDIVLRWNREVAKVLGREDIRARFTADGLDPAGGSPVQFEQVVRRDIEKWRRVVREAKIAAN